MSLLKRIQDFLEDNFGNGLEEFEDDGVVVTVVAQYKEGVVVKVTPHIIGGYYVEHYSLTLDFARARKSMDGSGNDLYTFSFNVREAITRTNEINICNLIEGDIKILGAPCTAIIDATNKISMYFTGPVSKYLVMTPNVNNALAVVSE